MSLIIHGKRRDCLESIKSVVESVVPSAFQIIFCTKIHINNVFSLFKNYFWHQHIKTIQNVQTILNFNKKNFNFLKTQVEPRSQTLPKFTLAELFNNYKVKFFLRLLKNCMIKIHKINRNICKLTHILILIKKIHPWTVIFHLC
jgi:hypothetical protein